MNHRFFEVTNDSGETRCIEDFMMEGHVDDPFWNIIMAAATSKLCVPEDYEETKDFYLKHPKIGMREIFDRADDLAEKYRKWFKERGLKIVSHYGN